MLDKSEETFIKYVVLRTNIFCTLSAAFVQFVSYIGILLKNIKDACKYVLQEYNELYSTGIMTSKSALAIFPLNHLGLTISTDTVQYLVQVYLVGCVFSFK